MGSVEKRVRKKIYCPICQSRLMDKDEDVITEEREMNSRETNSQWIPDFYQKCWKCGHNIGIRKIS